MSRPEKNNDIKPEEREPRQSDNSATKIIFMNIVTTSVVCAIFLGIFFTMQKSLITQQKNILKQEEIVEDSEVTDDEVERGIILDLGEFTMNLADIDTKRYLKVAVALEVTKTESDMQILNSSSKASEGEAVSDESAKKIVEEMEHYKPAIRDSVITILSSKVSDEISTTTGKELAKDQIKEAVDAIFAGEREVIRVSFGQFIIQ